MKRLFLALALCGLIQPLYAQSFQCRDAWGNTYRLQQAVQSSPLMRCTQVEDAPLPATRTAMIDESPSAAPRSLAIPRGSSSSARSSALDGAIVRTATEFGHDPHLLRAIARVESGFNPGAVSPVGAIGLMQVMPATARRYGMSDPHRNLFDPEKNLRVSAKYLSFLKELFNNRLELVIAAYNAGEGAVMKYGNRIPPYPETQQYVKKVLRERARLVSKPYLAGEP